MREFNFRTSVGCSKVKRESNVLDATFTSAQRTPRRRIRDAARHSVDPSRSIARRRQWLATETRVRHTRLVIEARHVSASRQRSARLNAVRSMPRCFRNVTWRLESPARNIARMHARGHERVTFAVRALWFDSKRWSILGSLPAFISRSYKDLTLILLLYRQWYLVLL